MNLAARAGRWTAAHWKKAVFAWLAFVATAFVVGNAVGTVEMKAADAASGESARAERILAAAGFEEPASETVIVQSETITASDPRFRAVVEDVVGRLNALPSVTNVRSPLAEGGAISKDGRSALVQFHIRGEPDEAVDKVEPIMAAVERAQAAHDDFYVAEFGFASATQELHETLGKDFERAEITSLPITLAILLVAFGALVAAGLPVLLAFSGFIGALGLASVASHLVPAADATKSVILLIGMAVGVDYALFYLRREREERRVGKSERQALLTSAATSGQAVLVSGLTVLIAVAGLLFTGNAIFTSMAIGAIVMVAVAVIGSLTVLPAVLAKLGDRVEKGRIPFLGRLQRRSGESRLWSFVLDRVLRRPAVSLAVTAAALLALAVPALGMHTQLPSLTDLPKDLQVVQTYERIQAAFPGSELPATVVVKADDLTTPEAKAAIAELKRRAVASGQMFEPITVEVNPAHTVARIDVPLQGDSHDEASREALATLREQVIPATVGTIPGAEVAVTGETAGTFDFNELMKDRAPLVIGFVLALAFALLLVAFRSVVVPLKAIVLNLLSVGAAYGILVAVFQWGWGESLLGFESNGAIASWLPLFLFVLLFALSMDYHVFILSRVKELVDRGVDTEQAVARGIKATAGTVTSAAVVMVAVFAIFATLSTLDIKQMGVGLAVAVLIDATIVRAVLLPAAMKLLGDWNWYLPRWLEWLPRMSLEAPDAEDRTRERPSERVPVSVTG